MFSYEGKGDLRATEEWLKKLKSAEIFDALSRFGQEGVNALAAATPVESGETANSWYYEIEKTATSWAIIWGNRNVVDGRPIAVLLQFGHGTGTGGFVQGRDYINPALRPIFDRMAAEAERVVNSA